MERELLNLEKLTLHPIGLWEPGWLLLTSGDFPSGQYNCMTVSWGSLGVMWGRPFAQVVVRPHRYTFGFIERFPTFTLCAFPKKYRPALNLLGTKSGRDGDKIAQSGLTVMASQRVAAPCFAQAELVLECNKLYWQDMDPAHFLNPAIDRNYPKQDYHRSYFGEIVAAFGNHLSA